jgi:hypothetical protein
LSRSFRLLTLVRNVESLAKTNRAKGAHLASEHFDVVVPLTNKTSRLRSKVPIPLAANATVQSVRAPDLMTISAQAPSSRGTVNGTSKVILWADLPAEPSDEDIGKLVLPAVFSLNFFSSTSAAAVSRAYILRTSRKQHLKKTVEIGGYNHNSESTFEIDDGVDFSQVPAIFSGANNAVQKDRSMKISMARFCSAVSKPYRSEKIIDICICLESIFNAATEISFRFSLYNTLLSTATPADRPEVYKRLKKLYDMRSKIVHGSSEGDDAWVEENWAKVVRVAKLALLQKIEFLQRNTKEQWQENLDRLALGVDPIPEA